MKQDKMEQIVSSGAKRPVLQWMKARELAKHPLNWRMHTESQRQGLKEFMKEVGWAGVLLYNSTTKRLLDGHLRQNSANPEEEVPVLVGEWTEEQERKILALLDPLGAMAVQDDAIFRELAQGMEFQSHDLQCVIEEMAGSQSDVPGKVKDVASSNTDALALRPQEHYDYVLVLATTFGEWAELCELLDLKIKPRGASKLGFGRGIRASEMIKLLRR